MAGKDRQAAERTAAFSSISLVSLSLLALVVGIVTGLGAVLFRDLIGLIHNPIFLGKLSLHYDANLFTASPWGPLVQAAFAARGLPSSEPPPPYWEGTMTELLAELDKNAELLAGKRRPPCSSWAGAAPSAAKRRRRTDTAAPLPSAEPMASTLAPPSPRRFHPQVEVA